MGNCSRHQNKIMDLDSISPSVIALTTGQQSECVGSGIKPKRSKPIRRKSSRVAPRRKWTPRMSPRTISKIPEEEYNRTHTTTPRRDTLSLAPSSARTPRSDRPRTAPRSARSSRSAKCNVQPSITQLPLYQSFVSAPRLNMNFSDFLVKSIRDHNINNKEDGLYVSPNFFRKPQKRPKLQPIVVRIPTMTDMSSDTASRSTELSELSRTASFRTSRSRLSTVKENLSLADLKPSVPSMCDTVSRASDSVENIKQKRSFCCFCWN